MEIRNSGSDEKRARKLGATIPLFSLRTARNWGIGEIPDLVGCARWLKTGGFGVLQILPPHELAKGETSPYGARTAFGIDPIFLALEDVPELAGEELEVALGEDGKRELTRVRALPAVDYQAVRALKTKVLAEAFARFEKAELAKGTARAERYRSFVKKVASWEDDLALYVALRHQNDSKSWRDWPESERHRDPATLSAQREMHGNAIEKHRYGQWLASEQWSKARAAVRALGLELMGDLPFVVGTESADVWAHPNEFDWKASLGAPPDAFSPDGQDWGLPPYRWSEMEKDDFAWLRARVRRAAELYDRFRLDHLIGLFRMYVVVGGDPKKGHFEPENEAAQTERGARMLGVMVDEARSAGTELIAEDLGVVPDWVRAVMREKGVPGYRVIPWERDFERNYYRRPQDFPPLSVAAWSTHDTAPINQMWNELQQWERDGLADLIGVPHDANAHDLWRAQMRTLMNAGSSLALVLGQEILGDDRRINTPGTVGPQNWTYRFPQTFDEMGGDPRICDRMTILRDFAAEGGR
ncbi:MAG: 4-alpha-glucanotransferase [Polyangiaceae bacterium]